ncbi:hypothetical protein M9H77_22820 [Catharanthus roseus]|uniref:Uncharacterized protein n=1 Tax=Catharanthus roseus TaxID=4058 RepID=A0ACC0AU36_CATRO|nr:hypothetical protein M9H77_22820 [Catharanthus roseus]
MWPEGEGVKLDPPRAFEQARRPKKYKNDKLMKGLTEEKTKEKSDHSLQKFVAKLDIIKDHIHIWFLDHKMQMRMQEREHSTTIGSPNARAQQQVESPNTRVKHIVEQLDKSLGSIWTTQNEAPSHAAASNAAPSNAVQGTTSTVDPSDDTPQQMRKNTNKQSKAQKSLNDFGKAGFVMYERGTNTHLK